MGCCLSKKKPSSIPLSSGDVKSPDPDPVKPKPIKPVIEQPVKAEIEVPVKAVTELRGNPTVEEAKPTISEKVERWKKRESDSGSGSGSGSVAAGVERSVVRTSSFTKDEVDAILIQCGKLSRSNSATKTRRHSGSKRSFDLEEEEEAGRRKTPQRNRGVERVNGSPRERRRRTPSRERERERERESYRSGSRERERERGGGGGSRRVSRSPGRRNPNSGSLVNSSDIKFVTVPATDKNGDPSIKRVTTVKRSIGGAAAMSDVQPPPHPPSSLSRSSSRKGEQSPYRRRNPLGEIDQNATKGDDEKKKMVKRDNEAEAEAAKPQRSHPSLRKSRDFETSEEDKFTMSSYTALLLKDIKNFHAGKTSSDDDDDEDPLCLLPSCLTKACSIVEAVEDLNSTTCLLSDLNHFRFTSTGVKKADLIEPSLEKYVTLKRGGSCSLEEQESCGSNNIS
ncbi:hypothetical protein Bca4012_064505 [Brassica carinata]|uniref:Uncharacterized protein n=1 Tax=Brassica carinata TaxID=52824 RepID=A0A8X7VMB1_BRACI|nr:hypothetical protein Bca52824_016988 [Brassica carinata]